MSMADNKVFLKRNVSPNVSSALKMTGKKSPKASNMISDGSMLRLDSDIGPIMMVNESSKRVFGNRSQSVVD